MSESLVPSESSFGRSGRITRVLAGVIRQACADAQAARVTVTGSGPDAEFVKQICEQALGSGALSRGELIAHPASKTALLLGSVPRADILPLGDLYYSQVVELAGGSALPEAASRLGQLCGGPAQLDAALHRFFDERSSWDSATAGLSAHAAEALRAALDAARFQRSRVGLVPKLGARTLGIDLYA